MIFNNLVLFSSFPTYLDEDSTSLPIYEYNCRCGGSYRLSNDQQQETLNKFKKNLIASLMLACDTCSLYIRVIKDDLN